MLGDKIAQLRKMKNLTQVDLSKILNVSPQAVSKWEKNVSQPNFDVLTQIAEYFNVSLDYFREEDKQVINDVKPQKEVEVKNKFTFSNFLYNYRQWFLSGLSFIIILLFFCNFAVVDYPIIKFSFNGFQSIIALFMGEGFMNYLYGLNASSYNENLTTITSFICICYALLLITSISIIIRNMINYFTKKENVNTLNLSNAIFSLLFMFSLIVLRFILGKHFSSNFGIAKVSAIGIWFMLALILLVFSLTLYFKRCKYNNEIYANENISFRKNYLQYLILLICLMIVSFSIPSIVFNINEGVVYSLYQAPELKYSAYQQVIISIIGIVILLINYFNNKVQKLGIWGLITGLILLTGQIYNTYFTTYTVQSQISSYTAAFYIPLVLFLAMIYISIQHIVLLRKVKQEYNNNLNFQAEFEKYYLEKEKHINTSGTWLSVIFGVGLIIIGIFIGYFIRRFIENRPLSDGIKIPIIIMIVGICMLVTPLIFALQKNKKNCLIKNQYIAPIETALEISIPTGLFIGMGYFFGMFSNSAMSMLWVGIIWLFGGFIANMNENVILKNFYVEKNIISFEQNEQAISKKRTFILQVSLLFILTITAILLFTFL